MNENNNEAPPLDETVQPGEYEPQPEYGTPPPYGEEPANNYREYITRRREHLAAHITPEVLAYLEEEFQTNLPCYQMRDPITGQPLKPDPIAAAIRDGQREVILFIRHEIAMHKKQKNNTPL